MNLSGTKSFISIFILLAFVGVGVFGLLQFSHSADMPMANCPYSPSGYSICENTLGHIGKWQNFLSVTLPALFVLLLTVAILLYFRKLLDLLNSRFNFLRRKYVRNNEKLYSPQRTVIKWLSLLENSPSLVYFRA